MNKSKDGENTELENRLRAGLGALAEEVGDPPPLPPVAEVTGMRQHRWYAVAAGIVLAALIGGVVTLALNDQQGSQQVATGSGDTQGQGHTDDSTSAPSSVEGDRVDVGNELGVVVGSISNDDALARRGRVRYRLFEMVGDGNGVPPDQIDQLVGALEVLEPVEVTDVDGTHVGYLVNSFVSLDDYEALREDAQQVIDDFES